MSRITEIPYQNDPTRLFAALRSLPYPVLLDSGHPSDRAGRFDIVAADPAVMLTTRGDKTTIDRRGVVMESAADPLQLLHDVLDGATDTVTSSGSADPQLPFVGGAIGYFGYDLGRRYERVAGRATDDIGMPEMAVGVYERAIVIDHERRSAWIVGPEDDSGGLALWLRHLRQSNDVPLPSRATRFDVLSEVRSSLTRHEYAAAFDTVKEHIRLGNSYQVNLTQRFAATVSGDAWHAYLALRSANPAPFSAFLDLPDGQILSSSPERFLRVRDGAVETRPIKGTRPRDTEPFGDQYLAAELRVSEKDRAENIMIVDLLRNDLGKCCVPGTVRADRLFEIESFASVHHLVSTVTGTLRTDQHALDLLRACFPGGSITGAPKLAAMRIIDDVEPHRRGVYCGCIGYIGFDGNMDTNIAIRTLVRRGESIYAWAGGGIVADSEVEAEYQESLDKAAALLAILEPARPAAAV